MEALGRAQDMFVHSPSYAIEADHYAPAFAVLNLRDPVVHDYWLQCWRAAHDHIGLNGIFLDSSFNLSSDKFSFVYNPDHQPDTPATSDHLHLLGAKRPVVEPRSAVLSQYRAHLDLMTEMQQIGYHYCNEDIGVFGIHRHGPSVAVRLDSLPLWEDTLATFDVPVITQLGENADDVFFRALAYRMMWILYWDIDNDALSFHLPNIRDEYDRPTAWHLDLLKAYNLINPYLYHRRILDDEAGVCYQSNGKTVLWAFSEFSYSLDAPTPVHSLLERRTLNTTLLEARPRQLYLIGE
jgi:hypothetical protein